MGVYSKVGKRALDLILVVPLWLLSAPLIMGLLVAARLFLGKPALFKQTRPGLGGKPFIIYKLRTMTDTRDQWGDLLPDEARLTRFGRIMRATSLDELPELFNVLVGDMSLVGPRPLLMEYLPLYDEEQMRRHAVRPGITGWAQVNGRNELTWKEKFALDTWYVDHASFRLDMTILALTMAKVIKREGINQPGAATAKKFTGGS